MSGLATRAAGALVNPRAGVSETCLRAAVEGKVILVTGASRGIGEATARRLGAAGASVLLAARSADRLEEIAAEIREDGGDAYAIPADVGDPEGAKALAGTALERFGHVDVLVSNAGKSINRSVAAAAAGDRFHDYDRTMHVNYLGPVQLVLALLPSMRARSAGHIVNVSTAGVFSAAPSGWTAYVASKHAFDSFIRGASIELAGDGIKFTSVYMTLVRTEMSAPSSETFRNVPSMSAEQAADRVCHGIAHESSRVAPWWGVPAEIGQALSHLGFDRLQRRYFSVAKARARREKALKSPE